MKTVTAFSCDFCHYRRPFKTAGAAKRHENGCYKNPANRACATCKHFEMVNEEAYIGHRFGEPRFCSCRFPSCSIDAMPGGAPDDPKRLTSDCPKWERKEAQ